jgi:hypothetical protein
MKIFSLALVTAIILIVGCIHKAPLTTEHSIAIDPEILGLWERVPGESKGDPTEDRMVILKWSDTEYVAQSPMGEKGDFYRAYPVEIGDRRLIQAESLGSSWGEVYEGERVDYPILTYRIVEGILIISTLNPRVVDVNIADTDILREAFLANINRQDLFEPPAHFRRIENQ